MGVLWTCVFQLEGGGNCRNCEQASLACVGDVRKGMKEINKEKLGEVEGPLKVMEVRNAN